MHAVAKSLALLPVVLFASACGLFEPSAADPHATEAVMVDRAEPPHACRALGDVAGDVFIGDLAAAHRDLVKNAADAGGNYVAIDETERHPGGYGVRGRLFQCPRYIPSAPPVVAAAPVVAPVIAPPAPAPALIVAVAQPRPAPPTIAATPEIAHAPKPTIAATPAPIVVEKPMVAPADKPARAKIAEED